MSDCNNIDITQDVTEIEITQDVIEIDVIVETQSIEVTQDVTEVHLTQDVVEVDVGVEQVVVVEAFIEGPQGPQGPKGDDADSDTRIQIEAAVNISALKVVRAINATQVDLADSTGTFIEARVLGMATEAILAGNTGTVQFYGVVEDAFFTYAAGEPLFLTQDGDISNVQDPLSVYNSTIGQGLGVGAIFIDIREPIEL